MIIYTDGSFSYKVSRDATGYACIIVTSETDEVYTLDIIYGRLEKSEYTKMNNVGGEIWAALVAVDYARDLRPKDIDLYYDYAGVEHWVTKRWQAKNPTTQAYGRKMREFQKEIPINFHQVRGHTGVQLNEIADKYAKKGLNLPCEKSVLLREVKVRKQN